MASKLEFIFPTMPETLDQIIIQSIQSSGPIPFHDFMEMALYHPEYGYYTSGNGKMGTDGDYLTSCSYSSVFGTLLAKQLEEMYVKIGSPHFIIVEYGAGTGTLCHDILTYLKTNPDLYNRLQYCIIEKNRCLSREKSELFDGKVTWHDNIKELGAFEGCVISNELVDNFSIHQVIMKEHLMEIHVGYDNGFVELLKPAPQPLIDYFAELKVSLPRNFRTEINLQALDWIEDIASVLKKGFLVTIDYGLRTDQLYSGFGTDSTLVCFHQQKLSNTPYINIGKQDITTHVNFSALKHWGQKNGFELSGYTSQAYFLLSLGLSSQLTETSPRTSRGSFLHDFIFDLGKKMKVLVLQKNISAGTLKGLRFTQPLL